MKELYLIKLFNVFNEYLQLHTKFDFLINTVFRMLHNSCVERNLHVISELREIPEIRGENKCSTE